MSERFPGFNKEKGPEMTEAEAAEKLQSVERLPTEEQERLVALVTAPDLSFDVLGYDDTHEQRLTRPQMEKLLEQVLGDQEQAEILYITLTESGVELNENEQWWMERLRSVIE